MVRSDDDSTSLRTERSSSIARSRRNAASEDFRSDLPVAFPRLIVTRQHPFAPRYANGGQTGRRRHLSHDTGQPLIAAGELSPITTPGCLLDDVLSPIHRFILASHYRASARDSSTGITISSACSYVSAASPGIPSENGRAASIPLTRKSLRPARKQATKSRESNVRRCARDNERAEKLFISPQRLWEENPRQGSTRRERERERERQRERDREKET